jgi:hypothetical protein
MNVLNKRSTVIILSGIAAAVIVGVAISIHFRLSTLEPEGHREDETPQEIMNEILTGQPAHQEQGEESEEELHTEEQEELIHSENESSEVEEK